MKSSYTRRHLNKDLNKVKQQMKQIRGESVPGREIAKANAQRAVMAGNFKEYQRSQGWCLNKQGNERR